MNNIKALMLKRSVGMKKEESSYVNPKDLSVRAVVEGFIGDKGGLWSTAKQADNTGAARPKVRLTILDLDGVKEEEGRIRRVADSPYCVEVKGAIQLAEEAKGYILHGEDGAKAVSAQVAIEKQLIKAMSDSERKVYYEDKRSKEAPMPVTWQKVYPGLVIDVNIFKGSEKSIIGAYAGTEVSVEGLSCKGSIWLKKPDPKYKSKEYSVSFNIYWNFKMLTPKKQHQDHSHLYKVIPAFCDISPHATYFDVEIPLGADKDGNPLTHKIENIETIRYARIPLQMSFTSLPDYAMKKKGIIANIMPNESVDDFRREKKDDEVKDAKARDVSRVGQGIEEEEPFYLQLVSRMSVVPYDDDVEKEFVEGTALVHNVVVRIHSTFVMKATGITREKYFTRVMEAIGQSLEWETIGEFSSNATAGNKFNIMNNPYKSGCAGNIIHKGVVARCFFEKFLLERAFHPSEEFVKEYYSECIHAKLQYLNLKTSNPHISPNPMMQLYIGDLPTNKRIVPLFCLSNPADDYLDENDFTLCAITSTWFAEKTKLDVEGMKDQHDILRKIGRLNQEESDKCLTNMSDALYPVGEDPVILIYAVRNMSGIIRRFDNNGDVEEMDEDVESEEITPRLVPRDPEPEEVMDRNTGALDMESADEE